MVARVHILGCASRGKAALFAAGGCAVELGEDRAYPRPRIARAHASAWSASRPMPLVTVYNVLTMARPDRLTRQVRYGVQLAGAAWPQFLRPLVLELASHRPIREVLPGVHHWSAIHPKTRLPVDSYYIESARVVLDPMVPREGLEWFDGRGTPSQVVLTNRHHLRHSERY